MKKYLSFLLGVMLPIFACAEIYNPADVSTWSSFPATEPLDMGGYPVTNAVLDASDITIGTVPTNVLPATVVYTDKSNTFTDLNIFDQMNASNGYRLATGLYDPTEYITSEEVDTRLGAYSLSELFGATNIHTVIGGRPTLIVALPGSAWTNTTVLSEGTNFIGDWFYTNSIASQLRVGSYIGHFHGNYSGTGNPVVQTRMDIVTSDGTTTNVLYVGDIVTLETAIKEYEQYVHFLNDYVPSGTEYLGVRMYGIRAGGSGATLNLYGGSATYDAHLSSPSLSDPSDKVFQDIKALGNMNVASNLVVNVDITADNVTAIKKVYANGGSVYIGISGLSGLFSTNNDLVVQAAGTDPHTLFLGTSSGGTVNIGGRSESVSSNVLFFAEDSTPMMVLNKGDGLTLTNNFIATGNITEQDFSALGNASVASNLTVDSINILDAIVAIQGQTNAWSLWSDSAQEVGGKNNVVVWFDPMRSDSTLTRFTIVSSGMTGMCQLVKHDVTCGLGSWTNIHDAVALSSTLQDISSFNTNSLLDGEEFGYYLTAVSDFTNTNQVRSTCEGSTP